MTSLALCRCGTGCALASVAAEVDTSVAVDCSSKLCIGIEGPAGGSRGGSEEGAADEHGVSEVTADCPRLMVKTQRVVIS